MTLSYDLSDTPSTPFEPAQGLSASDVARAALNESLSMRSAITALQLQGQRLGTVSRAEFMPKLGTSMGFQRSTSWSDGLRKSLAQTQAGLDLKWRLRTGAEVTVANNWTRNGISGGLPSDPTLSGAERNLKIALTQPLLKGAGRAVNEAQLMTAESAFRIAARALHQTAGNLVSQALSAYLAVQQAQATTRQAQLAHQLAQQVNELNVALVQAGRNPRNVLLRSELDVSSARLSAAQAENSQRQALRALQRAMGRDDPLTMPELALDNPIDREVGDEVPDEPALVVAALKSSLELFTARESVLLAELALAGARDGQLPTLSLSVGSEWTPSRAGSIRTGANHFAGLSIAYSFDRAESLLEERTALTNLEIARAQLAEIERQVREGALDSLRNLSFALAQRSLMREAFELATQQLDAEVTRQRLGRISPLELTYAQQALAAANRQLLDASRDVFRARMDLALTDGSLLKTWGVETMVDQWIAQAQPESNR